MKTLKQFKEFLAEHCGNEKDYGDCKYDRKIYNWFARQMKGPQKVEFFTKKGDKIFFKGYKT